MAKVTVSIPDDLLERAKSCGKGDNVSQLVQQGLALLAPEEQATRPDWAADELPAVGQRLREAAQADYEAGFAAGYEVAKAAPWAWMVRLDQHGFNLSAWLDIDRRVSSDEREDEPSWEDARWPREWRLKLHEYFPQEIDIFSGHSRRSRKFLTGAEQALKDVWRFANEDNVE